MDDDIHHYGKKLENQLKLLAAENFPEDVNIAKVAAKLDKYSGADIRALVDRAAESAIRTSMRSGKIEPITTASLVEVSKEMLPSTKEWLDTASDYAKYSNQSGLYDQVRAYLQNN
jgi:SpoVK/Ycf46/Vps4 family AAA+-type ATPase